MKEQKIAFIGAGNMAAALIKGLLQDGHPADNITAADPDRQKLDRISEQSLIHTTTDNSAAVAASDVVVIAVKPQIVAQVAAGIAATVAQREPLLISIAAGIPTPHLQQWLGESAAIVRAMPNTPAMLQAGATGLFAADRVSAEQHSLAESIMRAVGLTIWVDEEAQIDTVTAVSGSGPAYFFLFMEHMIRAAKALGLPDESAHLLTLQTALGASRMALESDDNPATLRAMVTSPGGTTERAINSLEEGGLEQLVLNAMRAARERSIELSSQIGD
ncbi:MAG: pyrroline-5-carboxylate reductase [Pseudomonadota bacterium]